MRYDHFARTMMIMANVAIAAAATKVHAADRAIITAEFHPGGTSDSFEWRLSVFGDGRIEQEVKVTPGWGAPDDWQQRGPLSISAKRLKRFFDLIDTVKFCELGPEYSAIYQISESPESWRIVTDQDTVVLAVDHNGTSCRVSVYGAEDIAGSWKSDHEHPKKDEVQRFCRLWGEVLALAPAPNKWQKARMYR
jgi:hypothetical protein